MLYIKNLSFTFFLLLSWRLLSQDVGYFEGKLVDSSNNSPIVFATIQLKRQSIGIISNLDGSFRIPNYYQDVGSQLVISCIGYKTVEVSLADLSQNNVNTIYMNVEAIELDSVTLYAEKRKKQSPRKVIKEAIKSIPNNYSTNNFSLLGYYREYQLENGEYVNLSEASLEVFDLGFDEIDRLTTKVRIYDRKKNNDFAINTLSRMPYDYKTGKKTISKAFLNNYGGNEFVILRIHDPIRNYNLDSFDFVNELQSDFLVNHSFSTLGSLMLDNEPLYVIALKRNHPDYLVKGKLYISKYDFSIHKIQYALYDKVAAKKRLGNKDSGYSEQLIFETITEYRKSGDMMFLNYSSFQNSFKLKVPAAFRTEQISFNPGKKYIKITFNAKPDAKSVMKRSSYSLRIKNNKLKINSIKIEDKSVLLYPEMDEASLKEVMNSLKNNVQNDNEISEAIVVEIGNVESVNGHILNQELTKIYYQFREFFVQRVNEHVTFTKEGPFMDAKEPIFGEQQVVPLGKEFGIWMNTPLKTLKTSE